MAAWQYLIAGVICLAAVGFIFWGISRLRISLPTWHARDWRAMTALLFSVIGAATLTVHRAWLVSKLEAAGRSAEIAMIAYGDTIIIGFVLIGLGFAVTKRSFSAQAFGGTFSGSGGDDDAPASKSTTVSVDVDVDQPAMPMGAADPEYNKFDT